MLDEFGLTFFNFSKICQLSRQVLIVTRSLERLVQLSDPPQRFVNNLQVVIRQLLDASGPVTALLLDEVDHRHLKLDAVG